MGVEENVGVGLQKTSKRDGGLAIEASYLPGVKLKQ